MAVSIEKSNVIVPKGTYEHIGLSFHEVSAQLTSHDNTFFHCTIWYCIQQVDRSRLGSKNCTSNVDDWWPIEGRYSQINCKAWISQEIFYKECNPSRYFNVLASKNAYEPWYATLK